MAFREQYIFEDKDISLIFIANNATDVRKVEVILTDNEVDYTLMEVPYSTLMGITERLGIGFYVISGQADFCRQLLISNKLTNGLWQEDIQRISVKVILIALIMYTETSGLVDKAVGCQELKLTLE